MRTWAFVLAGTALVASTGALATGERARPGTQGSTTSGAAARGSAGGAISAFRIEVPDAVLSDLKQRLARARFPDELEDAGWRYGTNEAYLKELVAYWRDRFDWRQQERRLNQFEQFTTNIDGLNIHFIHRRSKERNALPLLITHGWPGSFVEFAKIIGPLTDPVRYGGRAEDAFDVIAPSVPGYGFSDRPKRSGYNAKAMAELFVKLMARLGYTRYGLQGGDIGAGISTEVALLDARHVAAMHLNLCNAPPPGGDSNAGVPPEELAKLRERQEFFSDEERGYSHIQGTKPQTLGYALNDSPVGLAAWIIEKFRTWCDCGGNIESRFSKDELLTNITLYWVTQTPTSAARFYYEGRHTAGPSRANLRVEVPTGCAVFPKEVLYSPRKWLETRYNLRQFTVMPQGGHFAALEQPELLVNDVRALFRDLRAR
jgi:pimeloyl-ACP methyl ester carboxylesterase